MIKDKSGLYRKALAGWLASGMMFAAQAQTIVLNINGGFVSGSISGPAVPRFELQGSFADLSTINIDFSADGVPSFTVDPLYPSPSRFYALGFDAGSGGPSLTVSAQAVYQRPTLSVFNGAGALSFSAAPVGWHVQSAAVLAVPEPQTYALMLAGLALIGGLTLRRRPR